MRSGLSTDASRIPATAASVAYAGLTSREAAQRLAARGSFTQPASSRSYRSIVFANLFTVFNLILAVLGVLTLAFGEWQDALFLGVLVSNSVIGIAQEVRAKRALDRLAALVEPHAAVVRDASVHRLPVDEIVAGDLVRLAPGDQVVADGVLSTADSLQLDESILTGESNPVTRSAGELVRSGSFVVEGAAAYVVDAVGPESYAGRITGEARAFRHPRSPLERAMNRLLLVLVGLIVPLGGLSGYALWERDASLSVAVPTAVAEVATLVPEGLILLMSLTFAVSALRMARRGALVQQLNAIESLAAVDVLCLDKTGTLTDAQLHVQALIPAATTTEDELRLELGRYAASAPTHNATLAAIAEACRGPAEAPVLTVPFSSRRRWGALGLAGKLAVLGAPELFSLGDLGARAASEARAGRRVVAFGSAPLAERFDGSDGPPADLQAHGLVVLAERLRPMAVAAVAYFQQQGVELKILSGDRPETVGAIASDVGIRGLGRPLDGESLPTEPTQLVAALRDVAVVGRISPEGKRRVVEALSSSGRYVAMVGDGVNDVPALKAARLAIAQGGGTQMAKSVADIVLVDGDFAAVPAMVAEGRKVLRNLQRVAKLFIAKSAFATFLILSVGLTPTAYPLLPRHLTLAASLTIGIPAFLLALAPSAGPYRSKHFLRDVARFAVPAGAAAGIGVLAAYLFALNVANLSILESRSVAVTVLVVIGLYLIVVLESGTGGSRSRLLAATLCAVMAAIYAGTLLVSATRSFFALAFPSVAIVVIAAAGVAIAISGLWLTDERFTPRREES